MRDATFLSDDFLTPHQDHFWIFDPPLFNIPSRIRFLYFFPSDYYILLLYFVTDSCLYYF